MELTTEQKQSIANYRKAGIEISLKSDGIVCITQKQLINGYILNQKQLHERAREIFKKEPIKATVYSLDVNTITLDWIKSKMTEFGLKRKDLIKQLAIDSSTLSLMLSGERGLTKTARATFYYYFLTYELNRSYREHLNS